MQATPHIEVTNPDLIAKTVLMPGDPLRAKFIAEKYLTDVVCFNHVRGMLGYTGYYKGTKVSVMGSGMGMPSIGIYSFELFNHYGVENIIRIGSAGAYTDKLDLFDVVLVKNAYSESTFALVQGNENRNILASNEELNSIIKASADALNMKIFEETIHSSDVFYHKEDVHERLNKEYGCACVEMESFALFHNASVLGKKAACLLTISDSFITHKETTSLERQTAFNQMMQIALELAE